MSDQPVYTAEQAIEAAARVLDRFEGAPMKPTKGWPENERDAYIWGQLDAANSWQHAIRAIPIAPLPEVAKTMKWLRRIGDAESTYLADLIERLSAEITALKAERLATEAERG